MRAIRAVATIVAVASTVACFEEPIRQHLHLTLVGGEVVVVTAAQDVAPPDIAGSNQQLADRLEEARAEIDRGWDRWRQLFDDLDPAAERSTIERVDGHARRALYAAVVGEFEPVQDLLSDAGLGAELVRDGGMLELQLVTTGSPPATWSERREVERRIDQWSATVAGYLAAAVGLYEHLDRRPDRAVPCLSHLFDSDGPGSAPLGESEEELVARLKEQMEAVAEALLVGSEESYSLNELSRRTFDPFPTRLTVAVAGSVASVEGFVERDGFVERPPVDLWTALAALEGRWITPDLVTATVAPVPEHLQPEPDPEALAAITRRFSPPPDPDEVAAALRSRLIPSGLHVVRWRPFVMNGDDLEVNDPRELLDQALSQLPP